MKHTILTTLLALTLAACAPVAQLVQPDEKATIVEQGLSVLITNPGPDALTGDPSVKGDGPALNVRGVNIKPDSGAAAWCEKTALVDAVRWICNLPEIPIGPALRVTFVADAGSAPPSITSASLLAYRASTGARFVALFSK